MFFDLFDQLRLSRCHGMTALCVFPLTDVDSLHEGRLLSSFLLLGKKFLGGIFFLTRRHATRVPPKTFWEIDFFPQIRQFADFFAKISILKITRVTRVIRSTIQQC